MIPSRSRLNGWTFDGILTGAETIKTRGSAIETAATAITDTCNQLPELQAWDGESHQAALGAFGRAKTNGIAIGDLADALGESMTSAYWSLHSAKQNLTSKAADIEAGPFAVGDQWVVVVKPAEMTQEEADDLLARRDALQIELNLPLLTMGAADDNTMNELLRVANDNGFDAEALLGGEMGAGLISQTRPPDDVPNPATLHGAEQQRQLRDIDAGLAVRSTERGVNAAGEETETVHYQDGSKRIITQSSFNPGLPGGTNRVDDEHFDADGKLISTTSTWMDRQRHTGKEVHHTAITYANGDRMDITQHEGGEPYGRYTQAANPDAPIALDEEFFTHPALTTAGGVMSGVQTIAEDKVKASPFISDHGSQKLASGMKYGGVALSAGVALYDWASADSGQARCEAAVTGTGSIIGGFAGGSLGGMVAGPPGAFVGSMAGSWLFGWAFSEGGKAVC